MRLLIVSHLYPYPGVDRHKFVHDQAVALRELGVDVRVVSPTPYIPRVLRLDQRLRRRGGKPPRALRDGIVADYPRFLQPPRRILFERVGDLAYRRVRALPWIVPGAFDLIHAHQALPDGAIAQRLSRDLGIPYVVTVHGADVHVGLRQGGRVAARTRAVLREAAAVIAVSPTLARKLAAFVILDHLSVAENGGPGGAPRAEPADLLNGRRYVLLAGRLVPGKGHEDVLRAAARLRVAFPDVQYVIAGEGPLGSRLKALSASLGLDDRVHFVGRVDHGRLLRIMRGAALLALPSAPEGFGLVHLEAMTQGTPVIGCLGQGPADFIESGVSGYLVPTGDTDALTAVMAQVLADPVAAAAVGEAGRAVAGSFTWERNARLVNDIYRQVIAGSSRGD